MISGWTGTVKQIEQMRSSGILSGLRVTGGGVCGLVLDAMVTNANTPSGLSALFLFSPFCYVPRLHITKNTYLRSIRCEL